MSTVITVAAAHTAVSKVACIRIHKLVVIVLVVVILLVLPRNQVTPTVAAELLLVVGKYTFLRRRTLVRNNSGYVFVDN